MHRNINPISQNHMEEDMEIKWQTGGLIGFGVTVSGREPNGKDKIDNSIDTI